MPRYYYPNARSTTEITEKISIFWLKQNGYLLGIKREGSISWRRRGVVTGQVSFSIHIDERGEEYIRLYYMGETKMDYLYRLRSIPCFFGGQRWFFECGATRNGDYCGNRVGILYLKNNKFMCRECADLSYQSCNEPKLYRYGPFRVITRANKALEIRRKMRKQTYQGRPTKKYQRVKKIMGSITEEDIGAAEMSFFKN